MLTPRCLRLLTALLAASSASQLLSAPASEAEATTQAEPAPRLTEAQLQALYQRGIDAYHVRHERELGFDLFVELTTQARASRSVLWHQIGLWKQAQVYSNKGDPETAARCYEEALSLVKNPPGPIGEASYMLLLANLSHCYEGRGQVAEMRRIHGLMTDAARASFQRHLGPLSGDLYALSTDQLRAIKELGFTGKVFLGEASLRFEAGDVAGAFAIAEKLDPRLTGAIKDQEIGRHAELLLEMAKWHRATGDTAAQRATLERLLAIAKPSQFETGNEHYSGRLMLAELRQRQGEDEAPLFEEVQAVIKGVGKRPFEMLPARDTLARMTARAGRPTEAIAILDEAIALARGFTEARLLADLLVSRSEIRIDAGITDGVEADLFESLKWYRERGALRAETRAYVHYARYLRLAGRPAEARTVLTDAISRERRFKDHDLHQRLTSEIAASVHLAANASRPGTHVPVVAIDRSDLQPMELTTRVFPDETTKARFTVTNPGNVPLTGTLTAGGRTSVSAAWDAARLRWDVTFAADGEPGDASQTITLNPLDQALVFIDAPATNAPAETTLSWTPASGPTQTAWWRRTIGTASAETAVIETNLAMDNPFYCVPLHHFIRNRNTDTVRQNLRIRTSSPSRIELADADGRILAVDATGDGAFNGIGDIVFSDTDRDGMPDLALASAASLTGFEIYVYPSDYMKQVEVTVELQNAAGDWTTATVDRLLPRE